MKNVKSIEFKLLILTFIILCLSVLTWADTRPPQKINQTKEYLDHFFQPTLMKKALYAQDVVNAGAQGMVTRKQLEEGSVAVFRYGNPKNSGGVFPSSIWAPPEIEREIFEYLDDNGIDPKKPDDKLTKEERERKKKLTLEKREDVGYTFQEQRQFFNQALEEKQKAFGRELTHPEKEALQKIIMTTYPTQVDLRVDESEGIAVIKDKSIDEMYQFFSQRNQYSALLPEHFKFSYILKPFDLNHPERSKRLEGPIVLNPHEDLLFAQFYIAGMTIEYTDFHESHLSFSTIVLKKSEGKVSTQIPVITTAWRMDPRFIEDGLFEPKMDPVTRKIIGHNGKFGHKNILVIDGYLELSPYIAKDKQGFEWVDETRTLAIYHTYLKVDPIYKDPSGNPDYFREAESRKFLQKMMNLVQKN